MSSPKAAEVISALAALASLDRAAGISRFFKTGVGEYGENDRFLGVSNPLCRSVVQRFAQLALPETETLLSSPWHEHRLCALLVMVRQYRKGDEALHHKLSEIYWQHSAAHINNWDLVDLSAPGIIGEEEFRYHSGIIDRFAKGDSLWQQRIAVVSTLTLIRHGQIEKTLSLVQRFLAHPHDLMHKACGWMLREAGKQNRACLTDFLEHCRHQMPRTMLRYAIEHYSPAERKYFLERKG